MRLISPMSVSFFPTNRNSADSVAESTAEQIAAVI
jgi:hypothetical protein